MLKLANRVKETTTTTGTGTYSLAGAAAGFQTFVAGIGNGNTCFYCVTDVVNWEVNLGTVADSSPDTITRDRLIESSTGSAISWAAGTRDIFVMGPPQVAGDTLLSRNVLSGAVGQVDFSVDNTYDEYTLRFRKVKLATDNVDLNFRISIAAAFLAANYSGVRSTLEGGTPSNAAAAISADSKLGLDASLGNDTNERISGRVTIIDPGNTTDLKTIFWETHALSAGGVYRKTNGFGRYTGAASAIDAIRLIAGSGNISEGEFELWGRRNA